LIGYSRLKKGFVTRPVSRRGEGQTISLKADRYTDINELKALCTIVGPYGVRVIDRAMVSLIQSNAVELKEILKECHPVLAPLQGRFTEKNFFFESTAKLNKSNFDKLIRQSTIIGCILKFRETLREALQEVVKDKVPFIYDAVKLAHQQLPDNSHADPRLMALDFLAQDCGIDLKESDHSLRVALQKLKATPNDAALWNLLPELYGVSFVSPKWQEVYYIIDSEGHSNNIHCMAPCIHMLISTFQKMTVKNDSTNVSEVIQKDLERFVKCASQAILNMNSGHPTEAPAGHFPLEAAMLFLEQFIVGSNGRLQLAMLEECFPFTILRASYINLTEQQTNKSQRNAAEIKEQDDPATTNTAPQQ